MRPFLIGALCAALIGCCPVVQTCTSQGCVTRTAATTPIAPKRAPFRPEPAMKAKKVAIATKPAAASPSNAAGPVEEKPNSRTIMESEIPPPAPLAPPDPGPKNAPSTIGAKIEGPATGQPSETPDPVLKKAKITVAAKMENPASAEFVDMIRVMRKNTF